MGMRREARERAVQFLFQYDVNPSENLDEALNAFWDSQRKSVLAADKIGKATYGEVVALPPPSDAESELRLFSEPLIRGAIEHRNEADWIRKVAKNWDIHRLAIVDRNIIRLAIYEMLHREDIPPIVSINEAVDIAKKFSTDDSGKFVNGILDKVKGELMRSAREVA
jgi:N utilization substance protein B